MKVFALLALGIIFFVLPSFAEEVSKKVDSQTGYKLVKSLFKYSHPAIEEIDSLQDFAVYIIHGEHQGEEGAYGVNPWTGDVWDLWSCTRLTSDFIIEEQTKIKQRFKPAEIPEYNHLHKLRPVNVGLDPC